MSKFLEPSHKPKVVYTDNTLEFGRASEVCHGITALEHLIGPRRQNGIAERAVRRVKEGTSAVWLQSGVKSGGLVL